ncbi:hypothetical protein ACF0H5_000729 [Mactra antiquata]
MYLRTLIALCLISQSLEVTNYISHIQNYVNLVSAYSVDGFSTVDFPPLADVSKSMVVDINIHLFAINGFDEVAGNIELVVALEMKWTDEMSIIHSVAFKIEDRTEFLVPYDMIWTPKLVLTNAIGETSGVGNSVYLCRFDMRTKQITWKPRVVVSSSCTPDVTYYPFDRQTCEFIYTAWGFRADEIFLTTSGDEWNKDEYDESGEWNIAGTSTQTYEAGDQSYIKFTLNIVRKPLYFAFNILLPVLVLCLLNSTVFLLPAESGERVGFSVTCFLSFMVLLNMIMDIMPRSSSPISFLCYYLVVMMSNSGAMTLVTILLMRVYHKPEKSEVPKWLQRCVTFVNCGCAKLRCCVMCCRAIRRKCGCTEKGKCGCAKSKNKAEQDETLVEVTVKDNKVTERSVKKHLIRDDKKDKRSISKRRCTCFSYCSKSNEKSETEEQVTKEEKKNKSSHCLSCIRKRRDSEEIRQDIDHQDIETNDNDCGRKNVKVEHVNGTISNMAAIMNENEIIDKSKCFCINLRKRKTNKEKVKTDNGKQVAENLPTANGDIYSENLARKNIETCTGSHQEQTESNSSTDPKCFGFLRRSKVSTTDVVDIDNDILPPVKQGNESTKFNKSLNDAKSTKDDTNLLNGWDGAQNEDRNKKRTTLDPIKTEVDVEKPKLNVKSGEKLDNIDVEKGISGQTQSLENSAKETKIKQRKFSDDETSDDETLRETLRSLRSSRRKSLGMRQSKKKPDVNRRKSTIGVREIELLRRSLRPSDDIILDEFISDYPSEEDEVDSLADIEEEVSWPEVGRILDTFFLLVFSGGQAFFTVVFLVPLFTAPNSTTE